jgi:hypothetical protein
MPTATFRFGPESMHECKVVCGAFGNESYFVDGALVLKHWSLSPSGSREFESLGYHVKIEVSISLKTVVAKAYVNGSIVANDLFYEFNEKLIQARKRRSSSFAVRVLVWFAIAFIVMFILKVTNAAT